MVARAERRGSVLILVVWAVMLLSLLVVGLGAHSAFALDLTARLERQLQASYIALGGVQHLLNVLEADLTPQFDGAADQWANAPHLFADQPLGTGSFSLSYLGGNPLAPELRYGVADEERKLNLNTMPGDVFRTLLQETGGAPEDDARMIADSIEDWRDEDTETRPDGAEDLYYGSLRYSYESKDAPFENVEELLLVRGMTIGLFQQIQPYVTATSSGWVNVNTAPREVLQALGLSLSAANGVAWYRAGDDGLEGTTDDRAISAVTALASELSNRVSVEEIARLMQLAQDGLLGVKSDTFRATVTAHLEDSGHAASVDCIVNRDGRIYQWMEQ